MTAMLLLLLAGVPCEIVVADYSVSEANMQEIFKQQKAWLEKTLYHPRRMRYFPLRRRSLKRRWPISRSTTVPRNRICCRPAPRQDIAAVRGMLLGEACA